MTDRGKIRVVVGGWTYEPWRGTFYPVDLPQKRELEHASRQLTSIEINGTYYHSQKPESFQKWHDATPEDFVFSLKAPRYATNRRVLAEAGASIERFVKGGILLLRDKLGPINWQFMATKKFEPADFEAFLKLLPASHEGRPLRHVVEVRHESFRTPEFIEMLGAHGVAAVVSIDGEFTQIADPTAPFIYARLFGTREDELLGYGEAALDSWAERLRLWANGELPQGLDYVRSTAPSAPRDVFAYVIAGHKVRNPQAARALIERL
ncbi:MAG TPA: DUF72 domain-containing protein [Kiloniellales bacterium]|nr:DUF72 domain-containing protein [Kiloniellales bacterium]